MCLCFRWQKYTIFLLLLIVEYYFDLCPVVPAKHFPILQVCDFRGGMHRTPARATSAPRGGLCAASQRPTLRSLRSLMRGYRDSIPVGMHPRAMGIVPITTSERSHFLTPDKRSAIRGGERHCVLACRGALRACYGAQSLPTAEQGVCNRCKTTC